MRQLLPALILLAITVGATPADPPKAPDLRGTWVVEEAEYSGNKTAVKYVFEFQNGKMTRKTSAASKVTTTFDYYVNPTTKPMEIEWVPNTTVKVKKVQKGIFELNGDQLKICIQGTAVKAAGKTRPTQFKTTAGDGNYLFVLKRQK